MMKKIGFVMVLIFSGAAYGQEKEQGKCKKCKKQIYENFLQAYLNNNTTYNLVKEHAEEYFFDDLDLLMPTPTKSKPAHLVTLKFDELGCVYPEPFPENEVGLKSFADKKTLSFLQSYRKSGEVFTCPYNLILLNPLMVLSEQENQNFAAGKIGKFLPEDTHTYQGIKQWNDCYLPYKIGQINEYRNDSIDRIVFLVHGYNVPYSVGQIQYNNLIDIYEAESLEYFDKTLFIKVFWPSTANKKISRRKKYYLIKNKLKPAGIGRYNEVTARSYLVSLSLRKVLKDLGDFKGEILMMGHSMGSPTITSALIDPVENLTVIKKSKTKKELELLREQFSITRVDTANYFPKIRVFLNAPSMPGVNSFHYPEISRSFKNVSWTVGFNPTDRVLNKTFAIFRLGDEYGNTRLGGNWQNEAWKTKDYLRKYGYLNQFRFVQTGIQHDLFGHDFFCYLLQERFRSSFKAFLNLSPPSP